MSTVGILEIWTLILRVSEAVNLMHLTRRAAWMILRN